MATGCAAVGGSGAACVTLVHAWPGPPAVNVYLDGDLFLAGLTYGAVSGWMAAPSGTHTMLIAAAGTSVADALVEPLEIEVDEGSAHEVAALGVGDDGFLIDNLVDLDTLEAGTARLRVVHAMPDVPAVDLGEAGGEAWAAGVTHTGVSPYRAFPAGRYELEIRPAGTRDVVLPLPELPFEGNTAYSLYLIGTLQEGTLRVLPVVTPLGSVAATPAA